ncbi:MAG TPA: hypothetical protein VGZ22_19700 [Isosphaeraceae bacterium]|nr:hypothetical protein [Isosphaeraceae bacterium]
MAKHIRIPCPECQRPLRVRPDHVGMRVACKLCDHMFSIPKFLPIVCPTCQHKGRLRTIHVERHIRCKKCGTSMTAQATGDPVGVAQALQPLGVSSQEGPPTPPETVLLGNELSALRSELEARGAERASAVQQLGDAMSQLSRLNDHTRILRADLDEAHEQLRRNADKIASLERAKAELEASQSRLEPRPSTAPSNGHSDDDHDNPSRALRLAAEHLSIKMQEAEAVALRLEHEEACSKADQLEAEVAALQAHAAEAEDLKAQLRAHVTELEQLRASVEDADRLRAELRHALDVASEASGERDVFRDRIEKLAHELKAAQEELAAKHAEADRLAALVTELETARAESEALRRRGDAAEGAILAVRTELEVVVDERNDLRARCEQLDQERQAHVAALEAHSTREAHAQRLEDELRSSRADVEGLLGELQELDALRTQLQDTQTATALPTAELAAARSLCARLQDELQEVKDALAAQSENAEQVATLTAERDAAQTEREQVAGELDLLRARLAEHEQALDQARRGWETERRALRAQWDHEQRIHLELSDGRMRELQERSEAERTAWQARLEADRRQFEQDCGALQDEIEEYCRETETLRVERDALRTQVEANLLERNDLPNEREALEVERKELEERHRTEIAELAQTIDRLQQREAGAAQRTELAAAQLAQAQAEIVQLHAGRQSLEDTIANLKGELAKACADVEALFRQRQSNAGSAAADRDRRLSEALVNLQDSTARADRLELELQSARTKIETLCRDLALTQWGDGDDEPGLKSEDLTRALQQVEELTQQLTRTNHNYEQLRSLLDSMGVHHGASWSP